MCVRFGHLTGARIGHLAPEPELYLCEKDLGLHPRRTLDFFGCEGDCNPKLVSMWRKKLRVSPFVTPFYYMATRLSWAKPHLVPVPLIFDPRGHFEKVPPHLAFTAEEEVQGWQALRQLGLPEGARFVCFAARSPHYLAATQPHAGDWTYHDYRDSSIHNYLLAIDELTRRGYYCIRMGAVVGERIPSANPHIIDYASQARSDFLDLFLISKCHFLLSDTNGLWGVARLFRRPIAWANYVGLGSIHWTASRDVFITKKLRRIGQTSYMSIQETIDSGALSYDLTEQYRSAGIGVAENTPEEIRDLAIEMEERLRGSWASNKTDDQFQERFRQMLRPTKPGVEFRSRMGARFLRGQMGEGGAKSPNRRKNNDVRVPAV